MSLAIEAEHVLLAETVRRWCDEQLTDAERRAGYDSELDRSPSTWDAICDLGWTGLAVTEGSGGQGFGLEELAIVAEETGRGGLGGPFLPTALAATVVDSCGNDTSSDALGKLVSDTPGAVAFAAAPVALVDRRLSGTFDAVLGANWAELILLPVALGAGEPASGSTAWVLVDASDAEVTTSTGIDQARPISTVTVEDLPVTSDQVLVDGDDLVRLTSSLLLGAEAVGIAQWCVDTASTHAADRVQFGRPIGQFQGVKHRCADMLADTELARAAVWDASRGGPAEEFRFSVACAAALSATAGVSVAKDCIQVLGGIGFTWEHDAHLYLRRALATVALVEDASLWRSSALADVESGVRRTMPVRLPQRSESVRAEVRSWLGDLTDRPKTEWNALVTESGYLAPHWPRPWGLGADPVEQIVIDEEFAAARVRRPHLQVAAWALPTLVEHGTTEQQQRWMGPSMRQEITWCQLFSEPEAGSDLASLRMRAVRDDGGWLLTGQKVWTSMADSADWGICLARTDPNAPNHEGITCFFVDMASEGIEIRPLRELTGQAWFNEVFFDDVFVPDDCVIGAVNDGWRAGRTTLANERVAMGGGASIGSDIDSLVELLAEHDPGGVQRGSVAELIVEAHALGALRTRMTLRALDGANAGPEASIVKLLGVIHDQNVQEIGMRILGPAAATVEGPSAGWVSSFLWNRCLTIAGGTSEIQRNVIGERLLGLPKDN